MTTPHFVVDRPISLSILKSYFSERSHLEFGLMTNATVTANFKKLYKNFPCSSDCWICPSDDCNRDTRRLIRKNVTKIVDCGIFDIEFQPTYSELFEIYDSMGADIGIMLDVLNDSSATVESAKKALREYKKKNRKFELMLVAQGNNKAEYIECIKRLLKYKPRIIGIGGLLTLRENTARYRHAPSNKKLNDLISSIRDEFPETEFFILGCFHHSRKDMLSKLDISGSDYKGWIFNYKHKSHLLDSTSKQLSILEKKSPLKKQLGALSRKREVLYSELTNVQSLYARTKNPKNGVSSEKARYRDEIDKLKQKIEIIDQKLLKHRKMNKEKSSEYSNTVSEYQRIINSSEQQVRIEGVHKYLDTHVFPSK